MNPAHEYAAAIQRDREMNDLRREIRAHELTVRGQAATIAAQKREISQLRAQLAEQRGSKHDG